MRQHVGGKMRNLEGRGSATGDKGLIAKSQRVPSVHSRLTTGKMETQGTFSFSKKKKKITVPCFYLMP